MAADTSVLSAIVAGAATVAAALAVKRATRTDRRTLAQKEMEAALAARSADVQTLYERVDNQQDQINELRAETEKCHQERFNERRLYERDRLTWQAEMGFLHGELRRLGAVRGDDEPTG